MRAVSNGSPFMLIRLLLRLSLTSRGRPRRPSHRAGIRSRGQVLTRPALEATGKPLAPMLPVMGNMPPKGIRQGPADQSCHPSLS